ncbi:Rhomboid domain-containing protein [Mycena kentingensis (nom. inval.)]|nr:Rhomboid domain-containing protein [Mycena kentingensis (nom. inval.)]
MLLWTTLPRLRPGCRSINISIPRLPFARPKPPINPGAEPNVTLLEKVGRPSVHKQVLFVAVGTFAVYSYCAALTTVKTEEALDKMTRSRGRTWPHTITSSDMRNAADFALAQELRDGLKTVGSWTEFLPATIRNRVMRVWASTAQAYLNVSEGKRMCWKLCVLNIGVWAAWKSETLGPFMRKHFVHNPLSGRTVTLFTSMFSSPVLLLLGLNLLVIDGFGSSAAFHLTQRQERMPDGELEATSRYHFLAFFLSAGMFAALTSHIVHVKRVYPRLISRLSVAPPPPAKPDTWAAALRDFSPPTSRLRSFFSSRARSSASSAVSPPPPRLTARYPGTGVLYALMTLTALGFPSAEIALFYPPDFSVPIQWTACALLMLDFIGIWRGWKMFDHLAHLGANDLRTEYYESSDLDIYYSWLSLKTGDLSRPVKLTTWRGEATMYKEIPVPLPRGAPTGLWRLVLSTNGGAAVSLDTQEIGKSPFSVMSMPIQLGVGQAGKGKTKLQDRIERVYTLGEGARLRITEQTSFDLDKKIWDSGIGLSSWLVRNSSSLLETPDSLRILELGAGTGIVSLVLGVLRPNDRIVVSDVGRSIIPLKAKLERWIVDSAMPLLQHNIDQNKSPTKAFVLDWDEEELPECVKELDALDLLIMADVTYNTASFPALVRTIKSLVNLGETPPKVVMGYKERDAAERELWPMLLEIGVELKRVGEVEGSGGTPIEIWST